MQDSKEMKFNTPPAAAASTIYSARDASQACKELETARAICLAIGIAVDALEDGAITLDGQPAARWWPALDVVCGKLTATRDILINMPGPCSVDWFTPLNLAEALEAAM